MITPQETPATDQVKVTQAGGVKTLSLARPDKRNALTDAMYGVLAHEIAGAAGDPAVSVILLRGEGAMFTAGNDIATFANAGAETGRAPAARNVHRFLRALADTPCPLVAAVQGRAVGVGTTMLLHCDMVVLSDDALLTTPFVSLALVPEAASSLLLPARVGHARAFAMFALGEQMDAATAVACGLANVSVPRDDLDPTALAIAQRLAALPRGAVFETKRLMRDNSAMRARMDAEDAVFAERLRSAEAREAFAAFAERRPANFTRPT